MAFIGFLFFVFLLPFEDLSISQMKFPLMAYLSRHTGNVLDICAYGATQEFAHERLLLWKFFDFPLLCFEGM